MAKSKKKKSFWKKAAKAALIGGALYAGAKGLGKRGVTGVVKPGTHPGDAFAKARKAMTSDAAYGKAPYTDAIRRSQKLTKPEDLGIMGYKKGGRIGKQFGGGLGSTARRDMRSGYYPSDMGMRGGTMYKKGGRVKSMGIAKRGGGVAKK